MGFLAFEFVVAISISDLWKTMRVIKIINKAIVAIENQREAFKCLYMEYTCFLFRFIVYINVYNVVILRFDTFNL